MWALIGIISVIIFVIAGAVDLYLAWRNSKSVFHRKYEVEEYRVSMKGKCIFTLKSFEKKGTKKITYKDLDKSIEDFIEVLVDHKISELYIFDPSVKKKNC